jgi:hypothetical protein
MKHKFKDRDKVVIIKELPIAKNNDFMLKLEIGDKGKIEGTNLTNGSQIELVLFDLRHSHFRQWINVDNLEFEYIYNLSKL